MIIQGADDTLLYCESHPVPGSRGAILVVHGLGEHMGRYDHVRQWAHGEGLDVHQIDLRGHGRSRGVRGHVDDFHQYFRDLERWVQHLETSGALTRGRPCFILGHSMGGLISLGFLGTRRYHGFHTEITGLIVTSPLLSPVEHGTGPLREAMLLQVPPPLRGLQIPNLVSTKHLSHDPQVEKDYLADPLVHGWVTISWYVGLKKVLRESPEWLRTISCPVLYMVAGRDRVVDSVAGERFARKLAIAQKGRVKIRKFLSFYHEVLNEKSRHLAFEEMSRWIHARFRKKKEPAAKRASSKSSGREATGKVISH